MPPRTVRLSRLLRDERPPRATIAFGAGGMRTRADLAARVAGVAAGLDGTDGARWLVHTEDAFAAAASLLALWGNGAAAVLASNRQTATLARLALQVRGALLDGEVEGLPLGLVRIDPGSATGAASRPARIPERDACVAEFRTSGTTGDEKAVAKSLRHLEDEVETLETLFGAALPDDARVFFVIGRRERVEPQGAGRSRRVDPVEQQRVEVDIPIGG
jgi:acyl-CoA synthetase (AMP-forming)/AMP-acid ligase II